MQQTVNATVYGELGENEAQVRWPTFKIFKTTRYKIFEIQTS